MRGCKELRPLPYLSYIIDPLRSAIPGLQPPQKIPKFGKTVFRLQHTTPKQRGDGHEKQSHMWDTSIFHFLNTSSRLYLPSLPSLSIHLTQRTRPTSLEPASSTFVKSTTRPHPFRSLPDPSPPPSHCPTQRGPQIFIIKTRLICLPRLAIPIPCQTGSPMDPWSYVPCIDGSLERAVVE